MDREKLGPDVEFTDTEELGPDVKFRDTEAPDVEFIDM
jgi:hypothetical protein